MKYPGMTGHIMKHEWGPWICVYNDGQFASYKT